MKKLYEQWTSISLVKRIVVGLIIGAVLGLAAPQASGLAILGDVFVGALKGIAPLLVFFLIISSLCHAGKSHGGVIKLENGPEGGALVRVLLPRAQTGA